MRWLKRMFAPLEDYWPTRPPPTVPPAGPPNFHCARCREPVARTQRDLADALGVTEQQMQRYEATGYRAASLARLCDVPKHST
jgi:hypothetical protein